MKNIPLKMEDYFQPGFKTKPSVHVGSQTVPFFHGKAKEQAWEGFHLAGASQNDVTVVRDMDPEYIEYWNSLMGESHIINITGHDSGKFLSEVLLENSEIRELIKNKMLPNSQLMVFTPTNLEHQLADQLGIPLHGSSKISDAYGTKSGIRKLAAEFNISMPPGYVCQTLAEVEKSIELLSTSFETIVIKHDLSVGGYYSKKIVLSKIANLKTELDQIVGGKFVDKKDILVVEGWIKNKGALCAHIEILKGHQSIICSAWQQIMDGDGTSYMGAGPLMLSPKAFKSLLSELKKLTAALAKKGAIGSFGPDFIVVAEDEKSLEPDTCVLIELNARVPITAFPLEIIKQVKGQIGNGFLSRHVKLPRKTSFHQIAAALQKKNLLITSKDKKARGVVPFNIGLLPWKLFDVVIMADTWSETLKIARQVTRIFSKI